MSHPARLVLVSGPPRTLRKKKRNFMNRQEFDSQSRSTLVIRSDIDRKCFSGSSYIAAVRQTLNNREDRALCVKSLWITLIIVYFPKDLYWVFNSNLLHTDAFMLDPCPQAKSSNFATIWSLSGRRNIGRTTKYIMSTFPIDLRA